MPSAGSPEPQSKSDVWQSVPLLSKSPQAGACRAAELATLNTFATHVQRSCLRQAGACSSRTLKGAAPALLYHMSKDVQGSCTHIWMPNISCRQFNLCLLPQVVQPPPVMERGIMQQGPFPGSILVAAAAILAGVGFIGSKLYKAKAPEVKKVNPQMLEEGLDFATSKLIKALCTTHQQRAAVMGFDATFSYLLCAPNHVRLGNCAFTCPESSGGLSARSARLGLSCSCSALRNACKSSGGLPAWSARLGLFCSCSALRDACKSLQGTCSRGPCGTCGQDCSACFGAEGNCLCLLSAQFCIRRACAQ